MAWSTTPRAHDLVATEGTGFAGGLQCQAPGKGNGHSRRRLPCIPSRKAEYAATWDLIRGSQGFIRVLKNYLARHYTS